jgi:hypothetical protein
MKHKLFNPLLLCLLAMLLLACAKTEEVAAQGKLKGKTVKEMLCREWKLKSRSFSAPDYLETDTFGITFYKDYTFVFKIDPAWNLGLTPTILTGKWEFLNLQHINSLFSKQRENDICSNNICNTGHYRVVLWAKLSENPQTTYYRLFNNNSGNIAITNLTANNLTIDAINGEWRCKLDFKSSTK